MTIDVDATAVGTPLEHVWAYHGYDELNYTTAPEGEELLRTLAELHDAPAYVRTHFLFNTGNGMAALKWGSTNIYTEDADGGPIYDYTLIDQIMDATVGAGTLPLVELGFMPKALSTRPEPYENSNTYTLDGGCFYPPADYEKWGALVREWAIHVRNRYPEAEATWQWELWNEPDIGYWQGTRDEFFRLYDHTEAALHAIFPDASLGGPAVANPNNGFLTEFLEHCATGVNAVSGRVGTRLDMVSFHAKGGAFIVDDHVQLNLGNQLHLHRLGFKAVAASPTFASAPVVISEADPDGCAACPVRTAPANAYRNSPAYGAYVVAMMKRSLDLANEENVDLRGILTWAFTFPDTPYFAGYRALVTNGIHLPVLNAFKFLGSLGDNRIPVTSDGARPINDIIDNGVRQKPDIDALATTDGDQLRILAWNYHDDLIDVDPTPITLNVAVPRAFGTSALITHTRVDTTLGNAFAVWETQGRPETPSALQLAELKAAMEPVALEQERTVKVASGTMSLSFDLPRFGISLLTLTPSKESERDEPPPSEPGCSCRFSERTTSSSAALPTLLIVTTFVRRRRRPEQVRSATSITASLRS